MQFLRIPTILQANQNEFTNNLRLRREEENKMLRLRPESASVAAGKLNPSTTTTATTMGGVGETDGSSNEGDLTKRSRGTGISSRKLLFGVAVVVALLLTVKQLVEDRNRIATLEVERQRLMDGYLALREKEQLAGGSIQAEIAQLADRADRLQEDKTRAEGELRRMRRSMTDLEKSSKAQRRSYERTKRALSVMAQEKCEEQFPHSPGRVLITTTHGEMEIELAPCDLMPVVTMYFVKQVEEGFWDGTVFFRAESHVIQATDTNVDGSRNSRPRGLSIPFQEYSPDFTHHKYTLGIAGRPGGPDFYINMGENERIHGPGGQGHVDYGDEDVDSCFARIIRGKEVADKIQALPVRKEGGLRILKNPVEIVSMTLLDNEFQEEIPPADEARKIESQDDESEDGDSQDD